MSLRAARPITDPDTGVIYDCLAVSLAVSPTWGETAVGGALSLYVVPYGIAPDGRVHRHEAGARTLAVSDLFGRAAADPAFGATLTAMMAALQQYLHTAGI